MLWIAPSEKDAQRSHFRFAVKFFAACFTGNEMTPKLMLLLYGV